MSSLLNEDNNEGVWINITLIDFVEKENNDCIDKISCIGANSKFTCIGHESGTINILNRQSGVLEDTIVPHKGRVVDLHISSDCCLGSCGQDGSISIYDLQSKVQNVWKTFPNEAISSISLIADYKKSKSFSITTHSVTESALSIWSESYFCLQRRLRVHAFQDSAPQRVRSSELIKDCMTVYNKRGFHLYSNSPNSSNSILFSISRSVHSTENDVPYHHWVNKSLLLVGWGRSVILVKLFREQKDVKCHELKKFQLLNHTILGVWSHKGLIVVLGDSDDSFKKSPEIILFDAQGTVLAKKHVPISREHDSVHFSRWNISQSSYSEFHSSFFVVSEYQAYRVEIQDVVDRIAMLCMKELYPEALTTIVTHIDLITNGPAILKKYGSMYIGDLIEKGDVTAAQLACQTYAMDQASVWHEFIQVFHKFGKIESVLEIIPVEDSCLKAETYNFILESIFKNDLSAMLKKLRDSPEYHPGIEMFMDFLKTTDSSANFNMRTLQGYLKDIDTAVSPER